jgi:hypothetical protein
VARDKDQFGLWTKDNEPPPEGSSLEEAMRHTSNQEFYNSYTENRNRMRTMRALRKQVPQVFDVQPLEVVIVESTTNELIASLEREELEKRMSKGEVVYVPAEKTGQMIQESLIEHGITDPDVLHGVVEAFQAKLGLAASKR